MRLEHRRLFGLENEFYKVGLESSFSDLSRAVCESGFDDFSPEGVTSFLSFRYPILHHTMFAGFKRSDEYRGLESTLSFGQGRYTSMQQAKVIAEFLLLQAIEKKVANARRIGIALSGGLDSSLIVAMCRALYPHREIYTYSIGFYGDDEFKYARKVAKKFATKHYEKTLGYKEFFGDDSWLKALIKQKAAPLHPNELPLAYAQAQARKDCCDVVLCGEGADDVFGGYSHNLMLYASYVGEPQEFYAYILEHYRYFSYSTMRSLIHDKYIADDTAMIAPIFRSNAPKDLRDYMLYFIQALHTRGLIERGANALRFYGFNDGFVFLDSSLIDFVNNLPFSYKLHTKAPVQIPIKDYKSFSDTHCESKFLLKKIAKSYLPSSIITREKKGFPVPFALWDKQKAFDIQVDSSVFKSDDLSCCNAWEKFMIYNLNAFVEVFGGYRRQTGGGGETLERVGFLWRDSACSDKSPILRRGLAHYRLDKSLRPRLESGDFSSTILESFADSLAFLAFSKVDSRIFTQTTQKSSHKRLALESTFSPQANFPILSLRDFALAKSWQSTQTKTQILESQSDTKAQITNNAQPLESFAGSLAFLAFSKVDSSPKILESTFSHNAIFLSLRAVCHTNPLLSSRDLRQQGVAIYKSAKADSKKNAQNTNPLESTFEKTQMDCRAIATALARNDGDISPTAQYDNKKVDSRDKNAQSAFDKQAAGGRISKETSLRLFCDEKAGLCSGEQGDKTCGLSTPRAANSLLFRAKPTPKPSKAKSPNAQTTYKE